MLRNCTRNLTFKVQISVSGLTIQKRKFLIHQVHRILKTSYNTTQTIIIETLDKMQQKEEFKISNKNQITITKSIITKADYTKQILIMHYVE